MAANDAFFVPSRLRTTRLTSRRVVASTRHTAYTGATAAFDALPITMMAFAESSMAIAVRRAEVGRVGERRVAVDDVDALDPGHGVADSPFDLIHGWGRLGRCPLT